MTAKSQIELLDSGYKIKQNEAQDDNENEAQYDNNDNSSFVKNTQIDCTSSVSDNLVANQATVIIPETNKPLCYPPICQLLLDQLNRYIMTTPKVLFFSKTCF